MNQPGRWRNGPCMPSLPAMTACQVHGGRGHTCLLPILTDGTSCFCDICPTRYTICPVTSPIAIGVCASAGPAGGCGQKTTQRRLCGTDTATVVHVVLHCPALAAKVWPVLLSFLALLGLNRDDTDEGTFLLSLKRPTLLTQFGFLSTRLGNDTPVYH